VELLDHQELILLMLKNDLKPFLIGPMLFSNESWRRGHISGIFSLVEV
jgi:hypothetical protein